MKPKRKIILGVVAALALVLIVGGFAFSRGYLMHFVVEGQTLSRDEFYALADASLTNPDIHINCAQGEWTPGWLYIYEVHCFDTHEEVVEFMGLNQP